MPTKDVGKGDDCLIVHIASSFSGLVNLVKRYVDGYCYRNYLPRIPIVVDDGSMEPDAKAAFNYMRVKIMVSRRLLQYMAEHTNYTKVWILLTAIRHELRHYEQYIFLRKNKLPVDKQALDDYDAKLVSRSWADDRVGKMTPKQVNPDLYQAFHGTQPLRIGKVMYEPPPKGEPLVKIGRLVRIEYEPEYPSKRSGVRYYHEGGDTGTKILKSNAILATDQSGKQLYIVRETKNRRPYFSGRGIIG